MMRPQGLTLRPGGRNGLTLVESLVAIGIVAVLATLALAGIQQVRAAARRAGCAQRLGQIGMANLNYESVHGTFPAATYYVLTSLPNGRPGGGPDTFHESHLSGMVGLLPFLEQSAVFDRIDPTVEASFQPVRGTRIAVFRCPADVRRIDGGGNCNYRMNGGTTLAPEKYLGYQDALVADGPFRFGRCVRPAMVTGGLAYTAGYGERLVGDGDPSRFDPARDALWILMGPRPIGLAEEVAACQGIEPEGWSQGHESEHGVSWLDYGLNHTVYNHVLGPQATERECLNGFLPHAGIGTVAARSLHAGGVNLVRLDGSQAFYADAVDRDVWRDLGSIAAEAAH